MKVGDLIYDHEWEVTGVVLRVWKHPTTIRLDVLYSWGIDEVEALPNTVTIEVLNEDR